MSCLNYFVCDFFFVILMYVSVLYIVVSFQTVFPEESDKPAAVSGGQHDFTTMPVSLHAILWIVYSSFLFIFTFQSTI
jgi:hypothetical protein